MISKTQATKTVNPLHFEDLDPHRFEDMVRQILYSYRTWQTLEATGKLGSDEGIDIRGIEVVYLDAATDQDDDAEEDVALAEERLWVFQCKREKVITSKKIKAIVDKAIPEKSDVPYGLIVAVAADVTKATMDAFHLAARQRGVKEFDLWTKARLEDFLFQPRYDHLLFAYFGISLTVRRISRLASVRHNLTIKRKLIKMFDQHELNSIFKSVLIRDINDETYPSPKARPGFATSVIPPVHLVQAQEMFVEGLAVSEQILIGWVKDDGWDVAENSPNSLARDLNFELPDELKYDYDWELAQKLEASIPKHESKPIYYFSVIPFENILEIDPDGDPHFQIPHLYCVFSPIMGPYLKPKKSPYFYYDDSLRRLSLDNRHQLFSRDQT